MNAPFNYEFAFNLLADAVMDLDEWENLSEDDVNFVVYMAMILRHIEGRI